MFTQEQSWFCGHHDQRPPSKVCQLVPKMVHTRELQGGCVQIVCSVHTHVCVCMCACVCVIAGTGSLSLSLSLCMHVHVCVYMDVCMCMCVRPCLVVCVCPGFLCVVYMVQRTPPNAAKCTFRPSSRNSSTTSMIPDVDPASFHRAVLSHVTHACYCSTLFRLSPGSILCMFMYACLSCY